MVLSTILREDKGKDSLFWELFKGEKGSFFGVWFLDWVLLPPALFPVASLPFVPFPPVPLGGIGSD